MVFNLQLTRVVELRVAEVVTVVDGLIEVLERLSDDVEG